MSWTVVGLVGLLFAIGVVRFVVAELERKLNEIGERPPWRPTP